jgi:hypothetical protein
MNADKQYARRGLDGARGTMARPVDDFGGSHSPGASERGSWSIQSCSWFCESALWTLPVIVFCKTRNATAFAGGSANVQTIILCGCRHT